MSESAAAKKPGFVVRVKHFFRDIKGEVKKIVWPSKSQIINNTAITILVVLIAAVFVGCFDIAISFLIKSFLALLTTV